MKLTQGQQSSRVDFPQPLLEASFLGRRKRFFADLRLPDGRLVVAHCPNTGSMKGCLLAGAPALAWDAGVRPNRSLRYAWKAIQLQGTWVGVDTLMANKVAEAAIRAGAVPALAGFPEIVREQRMGARSRVDLLLRGEGDSRCYVEVKNVTLVEQQAARFPDAVTARGLRHLEELRQRVAEGHRAAMLYVVQRADASVFEPGDDIDPAYGRALRDAVSAGVELHVLRARVDPRGVEAQDLLPWRLPSP